MILLRIVQILKLFSSPEGSDFNRSYFEALVEDAFKGAKEAVSSVSDAE
jgi:hypothetical protein